MSATSPSPTPGTAPTPDEDVLSTMNRDGSRRWLMPKLSPGRFWQARRFVAYFLIAIFTVIPYLSLKGKPLILLDIVHREFTIFGFTFLPTDTILLALAIMTAFVSIFLITALFGRLWCGWACPQTVYMEFVFRPLERLFNGTAGHGGTPRKEVGGWRAPVRFIAYLLVCMFMTHTFLAYFVGVENLRHWVTGSPFQHPTAFLVMAFFTGAMMFDFCYFREQTCIIVCPYGRLQSALLDRHSLIVKYDEKRGEPRGKLIRKPTPADPIRGDCVNCSLCVQVCPTGIDIRKGLQMECIGCAQCIDVCDTVMDKIEKPRGLIRYGSQATMEGAARKLIRARVLLYPLLLAILLTAFAVMMGKKQGANVLLTRNFGAPFIVQPNDIVDNNLRLEIRNRTRADAAYTVTVLEPEGATLTLSENPITVKPNETLKVGMLVHLPRHLFHEGRLDAKLRVSDGATVDRTLKVMLLGPSRRASHSEDEAKHDDASQPEEHDQEHDDD